MEPRLRMKAFSPPGIDLGTARSAGRRLNHRATGAPLYRASELETAELFMDKLA